MTLRDTIEVCALPSDVFAFFEDMDTVRYDGWHPDHKIFRLDPRAMRLFLPRLVFRLEKIAEPRYRFIAELDLRIGPLAARLNKRELDAVREHMRIEGLNLKRFVEIRHDNAGARRDA